MLFLILHETRKKSFFFNLHGDNESSIITDVGALCFVPFSLPVMYPLMGLVFIRGLQKKDTRRLSYLTYPWETSNSLTSHAAMTGYSRITYVLYVTIILCVRTYLLSTLLLLILSTTYLIPSSYRQFNLTSIVYLPRVFILFLFSLFFLKQHHVLHSSHNFRSRVFKFRARSRPR